MISKTLFLVLLGTALVLANPVPQRNNEDDLSIIPTSGNVVEYSVTLLSKDLDSLGFDLFEGDEEEIGNASAVVVSESKWSKIKEKWGELIEKAERKWADIKDKLSSLKQKGLAFIEEAKETYDEIKVHGTKAVAEFKEIYQIFKNKWSVIKSKGADVYEEISGIIDELKDAVKTVKKTWSEVKQVG